MFETKQYERLWRTKMKSKAELEALMEEALGNVILIDTELATEVNPRHRRELEKAQDHWRLKYMKARRVFHVLYWRKNV